MSMNKLERHLIFNNRSSLVLPHISLVRTRYTSFLLFKDFLQENNTKKYIRIKNKFEEKIIGIIPFTIKANSNEKMLTKIA